jgi:hypothetical protein
MNTEQLAKDELTPDMRNRIISMMEGASGNPEDFRYLLEAGKLSRKVTGNVIIAVGGDEGNIAHFHYFRNEIDWKSWKNSACFMFEENKYFDHGTHTSTLRQKEMKWMVDVLNARCRDIPQMTNWQYLVMLWNDNNDLYEIPFKTPMPDYDYHTIKRYKK